MTQTKIDRPFAEEKARISKLPLQLFILKLAGDSPSIYGWGTCKATREAGLKRNQTSVYKAINQLSARGMLSEPKRGRVKTTENGDGREANFFKITPRGRRMLKSLAKDGLL